MSDIPNNDISLLASYGALQISGPKPEQLLQGQLSCDVNKVTSSQGYLGVHCNPKGRIIYMFFITKIDDAFYLIMPKSMLEIAKKTLNKYAPFYKAELAISDEYAIVGTKNNSVNSTAAEIKLPTKEARTLTLTSTQPGQDGASEWKLQNILDGIPMVYPETTEVFLPHELNLQNLNAIDFDKGCYTGQEIIARMHYRAKLKTTMCVVTSDQQHAPGHEIINAAQKRIATVVDCSNITLNNQYMLLITGNETDTTAENLASSGFTLISNEVRNND